METVYESEDSKVQFDPDSHTYFILWGLLGKIEHYKFSFSTCMPPENVVMHESDCIIEPVGDTYIIRYNLTMDHVEKAYAFTVVLPQSTFTQNTALKRAEEIKFDLHKACAAARKHFHETQQAGLSACLKRVRATVGSDVVGGDAGNAD